jgi:dipeptidyl aminopeptidase/acylaminoacyl peptidase
MDSMRVKLIEKVDPSVPEDNKEFSDFLQAEIAGFVNETVRLENGAEAFFVRSANLEAGKLHPMVVLIHGGPFAAAPRHMFLQLRTYLMI